MHKVTVERFSYAKRRLAEALTHCNVPKDVFKPNISWGSSARARVYLRMAEFVGGGGCKIREIAAVTGRSFQTVASVVVPVKRGPYAHTVRDEAMAAVNAPRDLFDTNRRSSKIPMDGRTYTRVREAVWAEMHKPRDGVQLSLPDIAEATNTTHSVVWDGIRRHNERKTMEVAA